MRFLDTPRRGGLKSVPAGLRGPRPRAAGVRERAGCKLSPVPGRLRSPEPGAAHPGRPSGLVTQVGSGNAGSGREYYIPHETLPSGGHSFPRGAGRSLRGARGTRPPALPSRTSWRPLGAHGTAAQAQVAQEQHASLTAATRAQTLGAQLNPNLGQAPSTDTAPCGGRRPGCGARGRRPGGVPLRPKPSP